MTHSLRVLFLVLGVLPTVLGCSRQKSEAPSANASQAERKLAVTVAQADARDVERSVQIVGTLLAQDEVMLANELPATIAKIGVDLGDRVRAGQVLISLDEREPRLEVDRMAANLQAAREALSRARQILELSHANVERAQAMLTDAKVNLKRYQDLIAEGAISVSQLDSAQTQYDVAVASLRASEAQYESDRASIKNAEANIEQAVSGLELARKRLKDTDIVAPFDGFVRKRLVNVGESCKEKTPLMSVVAIQALKLQGEVPERFAPHVGVGHAIQVEVEALCFIYMVLASQFESFVHSVTVMLSLPLTLPFALLTLAVTSQTLNLNNVIGIFLLMGVVKKNSILQVDYTNTLRQRGVERFQAIIEANHARLRPILMTTLSIVFGMVPIAFGRGDGAAARASMAIVVIGGQMLSLLLTLLATPVFYSLFDDLGTFRWTGALLRVPASVWDRFRWGWSRVERGRRPEVS